MATKKELIQRQKDYCTKNTFRDLVDGALFADSMRKLGYRNFARAVDELIDNSIEAGAENFHLVFGYDNPGDTRVRRVAMLDDGVGMIPAMITRAVMWGGTDRHNSRAMFGRFGFGLPSASVSQGKAFTVYSRTDDGRFLAVTIDLDEMAAGGYTNSDGRVVAPEAAPADLPGWITNDAESNFPGGPSALRTVVVWDKLDNRQWNTTTDLERNLLWRFGVTYRGFLRKTSIRVNGKKIEPIDPLFSRPDSRYFESAPNGAEPLPGTSFDVKDDTGAVAGTIHIRYSFLPWEFLDGSRGRKGQSAAKARFEIRRENNGLIFTRNGRQIDTIPRSDVFGFQNNDKYFGVEIDFPAELDDLFGITTSKQSVTLSDRAVQLLIAAGVKTACNAMRRRYSEESRTRETDALVIEDSEDKARASEVVMEDVSQILCPGPVSSEMQDLAEQNLRTEIDRAARAAGVEPETIAEQKERATIERPFKIEFERSVDGPFYRAELRGAQLIIWINTAHRFYSDVYGRLAGAEGARVRAGLELLLFSLGSCEVEAATDGRIWYASERIDWSRKMDAALIKLEDYLLTFGEQIVSDDDELANA